MRALAQAVAARRPAPRLIHHSDRGSQCCSHEYQALLHRKGNCCDNAPIESFWGTLKTELVHHRRSRAEAAHEISEYVDPLLQPAATAGSARLLITGSVHTTAYAAATGRMNATHGVHY